MIYKQHFLNVYLVGVGIVLDNLGIVMAINAFPQNVQNNVKVIKLCTIGRKLFLAKLDVYIN